MDEAARAGFANGAFEELEEDVVAVVDEFYPEASPAEDEKVAGTGASPKILAGLRGKLDGKVAKVAGV